MPKNYVKVAQQAKLWSTDVLLSPGKRTLARSLADLAEILSDPQYGCPSEYFAADMMYCLLCKSASRDRSCAEPACPGGADCPLIGKAQH
jgi:hypothetical protein